MRTFAHFCETAGRPKVRRARRRPTGLANETRITPLGKQIDGFDYQDCRNGALAKYSKAKVTHAHIFDTSTFLLWYASFLLALLLLELSLRETAPAAGFAALRTSELS